MQVEAYLGRKMLARLLACLALVTGLAAVGVPANAAVSQAASQQVETEGQQQPGRSAVCTPASPRNTSGPIDSAQPKCRARKPVVIYVPTVQFGADRAFE